MAMALAMEPTKLKLLNLNEHVYSTLYTLTLLEPVFYN